MGERFFEPFNGTRASDWGTSWDVSPATTAVVNGGSVGFAKSGGIATVSVSVSSAGGAFASWSAEPVSTVAAARGPRSISTLRFNIDSTGATNAAISTQFRLDGTVEPFNSVIVQFDVYTVGAQIVPSGSTAAVSGPLWRMIVYGAAGAVELFTASEFPNATDYILEVDASRDNVSARIWAASASRPSSPSLQAPLTGDDLGGPVEVSFLGTVSHASVGAHPAWSGAINFDSLEINAVAEDGGGGGSGGGGEGGGSDVDLTKTICYNNLCIEGIDGPSGGFPQHGYALERVNISPVETVGYADKRALQDGVDAADVYLGGRVVRLIVSVYGSTRGEAFDRLQAFVAAYHPTNAFTSDPDNLGFLTFDYFRPTANISQWPVSTYPDGIPLRVYCRAKNPPTYEFVRQKTGGQDALGMAIQATVDLWAKDPRVYLQSDQSIDIDTSTTTLTYRGDYPTWPIITIPLSAGGSSSAVIVISGGSVKLNLSGLSAGTYEVDYGQRTVTKTSDNTLQQQVLSTSFPNDWRQVYSGSTARITSTTGVTGSVSVGYREAFA